MAKVEDTTKVEATKETDTAQSGANQNVDGESEDLLSLESLDNLIAEDDPEFANSLEAIGPDDGSIDVFEEGLDLEYTLEQEIRNWKNGSTLRQNLFKILPLLPKYSYSLKMKRVALRLNIKRWKQQSVDLVFNIGPRSKQAVISLGASLKSVLAKVKTFSATQKLMFVGLLLATVVGGFVIHRTLTHRLIPADQELFMGSMQEWSQRTGQFDPKLDTEYFYDSTRASQNIMQLKKMVTNLQRSPGSGSNPMGAFEFYVEGTVSEVLIEIKDREPEMVDLFLATLSEMTYDQIASAEGKQLLCDRLRKKMNGILTTGKVRKIFIKTAIIKP